MKTINEMALEYRAANDYENFAALCKENAIPEERCDQFWNGLVDSLANNVFGLTAPEKIDAELKQFTGGQKEKAVSDHVAKVLKSFFKNPQFAAAVSQNKKTLSDCCREIMKGVGSSISDIEVYRRAAKFYFSGASVKFTMQIEADGKICEASQPETAEGVTQPTAALKRKPKVKAPSDIIQVSLFDVQEE